MIVKCVCAFIVSLAINAIVVINTAFYNAWHSGIFKQLNTCCSFICLCKCDLFSMIYANGSLMKSGFLDQAWALFKGKYREGIDKLDPPTWKTRLRCALNKSSDFEELAGRSQLDVSEPFKVYRVIPEGHKRGGYTPIYSIYSTYIT